MAKVQKKYDQEQPAQESRVEKNVVSVDTIKDHIEHHSESVLNKVRYHLKMVKQTTGEITEEDVAYVISLSNRELMKSFDDYLDVIDADKENQL